MHYTYTPQGTCSRQIDFDIEDNRIHNVQFIGGCKGNLKAVAALTEGMEVSAAIERLKGLECGNKGTSCGDQFAQALETVK